MNLNGSKKEIQLGLYKHYNNFLKLSLCLTFMRLAVGPTHRIDRCCYDTHSD